MPTIPRKEYNEMKHGSKAMQDSLKEMMSEGYEPEPLPQAEKPSLLGFGREMVRKMRGESGGATKPPSRVRQFGSNMRYMSDVKKDLSSTDGLTLEKWGKRWDERKKRMEE